MSEVKVKEEPADKGYDKIIERTIENDKIKKEPEPEPIKSEVLEDDLDWVNDELDLDFLNDIDFTEENATNKSINNESPSNIEAPSNSTPQEENGESTAQSADNEIENGESTAQSADNEIEKQARYLQEIERVSKSIQEKKQQEASLPPVKIKKEKVTPPREIPALENDVIFTRRIKDERVSPPRVVSPDKPSGASPHPHRVSPVPTARNISPLPSPKSPTRRNVAGPSRRKSRSRSPAKRHRNSSFSEHNEDHLERSREQVQRDTCGDVEAGASIKRTLNSQALPLPKKIKIERPDNYERSESRSRSDRYRSGDSMTMSSDSGHSSTRDNFGCLSVMPQPVRIKQEPADVYVAASSSSGTPKPVKVENLDEAPMSHRARVLKFAKETIKNFDLFHSNIKFKTRFLYTPTMLVSEQAVKLSENRSPMSKGQSVQFEFSSPKLPIETRKWGIRKLGQRTAQIVHLLGFNAYDLAENSKLKKLDNVDRDAGTIEAAQTQRNDESFYVDAEIQTDELKCNQCIVRKLKKYADKGLQVTMAANFETPTRHRSADAYDEIPESILKSLSQLQPNQQTAMQEFVELILGPAPQSTNDITRMRERLMDIFTLAQTRSAVEKSTNPLNISRPLPASSNSELSSGGNQNPLHNLHNQQLSNYLGSNSNYPPGQNPQAAPLQPLPTNHIYSSQMTQPQSTYPRQQNSYSQPPLPVPAPYQPQPVPSPYQQKRPVYPINNYGQPRPPPMRPQMFPNPAARHPGHMSMMPRLTDPRTQPNPLQDNLNFINHNNIQINPRR